jgi:sugar/nucleoside kinase (ribokinase family)
VNFASLAQPIPSGMHVCKSWLAQLRDCRVIPCVPIASVDALGAGDAFYAGLLHGWHHGWNIDDIGDLANFLGAVVASKLEAIPDWSAEEYRLLQEQFGISPPDYVAG